MRSLALCLAFNGISLTITRLLHFTVFSDISSDRCWEREETARKSAGLYVCRAAAAPFPKTMTRSLLSIAALFGLSLGCQALDIRVLLISAKDGRPIPERRIQLACWHRIPKGGNQSPEVFNLWAYTDGSGTATFNIDSPIPPESILFVGNIAHCCSPATFSVDQVLRSGVSLPCKCPHRPKGKVPVPAIPGQIAVYSGEYSPWEERLYFPWPD